MPRTLFRQDTQLRHSDVYDDLIAAGIALETGAAHMEDDLNALRSQTNRLLDATGSGNWYDDVATVNSKKRGLLQLNTDLDDIEEKRLLCRAIILTDIVVPASQNHVILSQGGGQTPSQVIAVGAATLGAVAAQSALSGAGFDAPELIEVAGASATHPKNLAVVVDAATGQKVQSSGRDVFALMQVESSATDGAAFDDTSGGNRGKLSFVRPNATFTDLEAVPVADIENRTVRYKYVFRIDFDSVPEDCFLTLDAFIDQAASVDVNLTNAIANEGGTTPQNNNITIDLGAGIFWQWRDAASQSVFGVTEGSGGGTTEVRVYPDADVFNVDAVLNDFAQGIQAATSKTRPINIGVNDGVVETSAGNMEVRAADELFLDDNNQPGSWAQTEGIKLSETATEWSDFETAFGGEVSILNALVQAKNASSRGTKVYATVTSTTNADTDMGGAGGGANLSAQLPNMSAGNFLTDYDVFVNGQLQRPGADASANHDYYPGTDLALGQLRFEYRLKSTGVSPDVIAVVPYA